LLFGVIADDLTGAGDTGVQFSNAGLKTRIFLDRRDISRDSLEDVDVVVLNTESRRLKPKDAYDIVKEYASLLRDMGVKNIYKKVDSTLRGNIGYEIDAVMDAFDFEMSIMTPAFPANGRIVVGGFLLVNDEIVSRTPFANDPTFPVKESNIVTLLSRQSRLKVAHLPIILVSQGKEAISNFLRERASEGFKLVLADALNEGDLMNIAMGGEGSGLKLFYVGSAGLASAVAKIWRSLYKKRSDRITVLVCGSINPKSREQIDLVSQLPGWKMIIIDPIGYITDESSWRESLRRELLELTKLEGLEGVIVTTPSENLRDKIREDLTSMISSALSKATEVLLEMKPVRGFILTGGDTATAIIGMLEGRGLDLLSEVSPGIPIVRIVGGRFNGYPVITKAGGFGRRESLVEAVRKMEAMLI